MKKISLLIRDFVLMVLFNIAMWLFVGCVDAPKPIESPRQYHKQVYVAPRPKIIKDKREKIETSYGYKFDALNTVLSGDLKIRQQPSVATVYYLIFNDGSYRKVSMDEFVVRNIGDTIP